MRSFAVLSLILLLSSCQAFAPQPSSCGRQSSSRAFAVSSSPRSRGALCASSSLSQSSTALFSSPESENDKETTKNDESTAVPETDLLTPVKIEEESDVPLDIPSPLLLASSIILAIVSTGKSGYIYWMGRACSKTQMPNGIFFWNRRDWLRLTAPKYIMQFKSVLTFSFLWHITYLVIFISNA